LQLLEQRLAAAVIAQGIQHRIRLQPRNVRVAIVNRAIRMCEFGIMIAEPTLLHRRTVT
jgi:hypothetical protein